MYFDEEFKTANIGNDVVIGIKCTIIPRVKTRDGTIVGHGALVTKDNPLYSIAG
jgi:acetyltransferase-like isoleucine patch superfamily enzyme